MGIEQSAEKIAIAESRIDELGVTTIELVHDDVTNLPELGGRPFDAVVMKRVLGQLADPGAVLRDAAALVRPGGVAIAMESPEGAELRRAFRDAGLPAPTLRSERGLVGAWARVPD
jgi:ubiquinone/menaquinone biosynthesis C-methylase UbiE